jgi:Lar family restriction alleviation protein
MSVDKTEPLPCPFCGKEPKIRYSDDAEEWVVYCPHYGEGCVAAPTAEGKTEAEALAAWNTRA